MQKLRTVVFLGLFFLTGVVFLALKRPFHGMVVEANPETALVTSDEEKAQEMPTESLPTRPGLQMISESGLENSREDLRMDDVVQRDVAELLSKKYDLVDPKERERLANALLVRRSKNNAELYAKAASMGLAMSGTRADGSEFRLVGFRGDIPLYQQSHNVSAAISTAANLVRETAPFEVDGSGELIGLWEIFRPRTSHQEFGSPSRLTFGEGSSGTSNHATHVAGTMIAAGVNPSLKGMAPAAKIVTYDTLDDFAEMISMGAAVSGEAGKLTLSNHSYGLNMGWEGIRWNGQFSDDGDPSNDVEEEFGQYNALAASVDGLTYNLPYYLPFFSSGNHGNNSAPANGEDWLYGSNVYTYIASEHPAGDDDYKNGYDLTEGKRAGKNVMSVGAVTDAVVGGSRDTGFVQLADFSSAGPTDDGRIKPDVVANGVSLLSASGGGDNFTGVISGTSMASPNAAGSAALLANYYRTRFSGETIRAATLKGLILHTATDLGNPGPDYRFGWGLMDTLAAAEVLKDHADNGGGRLVEETLVSGGAARVWTGSATGGEALRVTLSWTDPAGEVTGGHDNRTRALVNDLNLSLVGPDGTHLPYVMPHVGDWGLATLDDVATRGVNTVDNVEQVFLPAALEGEYQVVVSAEGPLTFGEQPYSLIISGLSDPLQVAGANEFVRVISTGDEVESEFEDLSLTNLGSDELSWSASSDSSWLVLSSASGTLQAGESTSLRASLNSSAGELAPGRYEGEVLVTNLATGWKTQVPLRLTVVARLPLPFVENFEVPLADFWEVSNSSAGRAIRTSLNQPYQGAGHFSMDSTTQGVFASNGLTLTLDLEGRENLELTFWAKEFGDELNTAPSSPFQGSGDYDGVSISLDGVDWYSVFTFPGNFANYTQFTIDLESALQGYGLEFNKQFRIRFHQYDNGEISLDGIVIDDVRLAQTGPAEIEVLDAQGEVLESQVASFDLGSVPVGSESEAVTLMIHNVGFEELGNLAATFSGLNSSDFATGGVGSSLLAPGESIETEFDFVPLSVGPKTAFFEIVSDDSDENPFTIQVTGYGLHTLSTWREEYFQTSENSGEAADFSDPNQDGISNLMAFAVGLNPLEPGVIPLELSLEDAMTIRYQRSRAAVAAGLSIGIEWSDSLEGEWSTAGVVENLLSEDSIMQSMEAILPLGAERRFARLRVMLPPAL